GRRLEQPPVLLVSRNRRLHERIELLNAPQSVQAIDSVRQIAACLAGTAIRIEAEPPEAIVRLSKIAIVHQLLRASTQRGGRDVLRLGHGDPRSYEKKTEPAKPKEV